MSADGIDSQQFAEAINRIAGTPDGRLLYLWAQRRLMAVSTSTEPGALQADNGERRFAASLIALMAKRMAESGGRTSSTGGGSGGTNRAEQPIVFAVPKPRDTRGARGAGRRIGPDTRVPGYDTET